MRICHRKHKRFANSFGSYRPSHRPIWGAKPGRVLDFDSTVFVSYPDIVRNAPTWYNTVRDFSRMHKLGQRRVLDRYFPTPAVYPDGTYPYVMRPLNHFGGRDFYIVHNEEERRKVLQILGNRSYASELFKREKEYRHYFVGGKHIATSFKKVHDGISQEEPWNHATNGSRFHRVTKDINDKLLRTDFYEQAEEFFEQYPLDIAAIDTAWQRTSKGEPNDYTVFEINIAPAIEIDFIRDTISSELGMIR